MNYLELRVDAQASVWNSRRQLVALFNDAPHGRDQAIKLAEEFVEYMVHNYGATRAEVK